MEKMTIKGKLFQRVRNNPKDSRFTEVRKLLKDSGFRERLPEYQVKDALRALKRLEVEYEKR